MQKMTKRNPHHPAPVAQLAPLPPPGTLRFSRYLWFFSRPKGNDDSSVATRMLCMRASEHASNSVFQE